MKRKLKIVVIGILIMCCVVGCQDVSRTYLEGIIQAESEDTTEVFIEEATEAAFAEKEIYVHICGAVKAPGVYALSEGSRVYEAIAIAGGFLENAATESLNQAEELEDGQMLKILTKKEFLKQKEETSALEDGRININEADEEMLMTLPGIGESKAKSILSYRKEHGGFSSIEDLKNITGIKDGVYSKIKDYITID